MRFYTSTQTNSASPGEMLGGTSWGGFTEGVILPPNAGTVDASEFIGLIVWKLIRLSWQTVNPY